MVAAELSVRAAYCLGISISELAGQGAECLSSSVPLVIFGKTRRFFGQVSRPPQVAFDGKVKMPKNWIGRGAGAVSVGPAT
jgi:hypothetical protein